MLAYASGFTDLVSHFQRYKTCSMNKLKWLLILAKLIVLSKVEMDKDITAVFVRVF